MSAPHPFTQLMTRASVDAALLAAEISREGARALLDGVIALARQDGALALRLAMVLAWAKRQDPGVLGYASFAAFCREHVAWGDSWLRDVVRLVESPLDLVKAAVCRDLLPLRLAVKAPGHVDPEDQAAWLLDPVLPERPFRALERFEGDDAVVVQKARALARLLLGREASDAAVDDYIVTAWRERVPAETLLAEARERPERPEHAPLAWGWCADGAPAEAIVGPWVEPTSLADAVEQIGLIESLRGRRAAVLARLWVGTELCALWAQAGYDTAVDFARDVLGWSRRTAQRQKRIGYALEWYRSFDDAIAQGLDPGSVAVLLDVVGPHTVDRWIAVARRVGRLELIRAVREGRYDRTVLDRYERAIAAADAWAPSAGGAPATEPAPSAGGPPRVAIPHDESPRPEASVKGPRELPEASRWFVAHVRIEPQRGFGRVKERDGWRCQNPECGRASLRVEAHHIHPRSLGGSDEPGNGVTVCRVCHLRGLHADDRLTVDRVEVGGVEALWWRYPGGRSVLSFCDRHVGGEPIAQRAEIRAG